MAQANIQTDSCTWEAVHDFMPPGPARLRVKGKCMMPTPGYKLGLRRAVPQGINPKILLLDLSVTPPQGIVTQVLTETKADFEEETDQRYQTVMIRPGDIEIPVQEVH